MSHKQRSMITSNLLFVLIYKIQDCPYLRSVIWNLYAGQEARVRTGHGTTDWFQIGKGVCKDCMWSPGLFNLYAEYIMRNARLEEDKLESRLLEEISVTLDMQIAPPSWQILKKN